MIITNQNLKYISYRFILNSIPMAQAKSAGKPAAKPSPAKAGKKAAPKAAPKKK